MHILIIQICNWFNIYSVEFIMFPNITLTYLSDILMITCMNECFTGESNGMVHVSMTFKKYNLPSSTDITANISICMQEVFLISKIWNYIGSNIRIVSIFFVPPSLSNLCIWHFRSSSFMKPIRPALLSYMCPLPLHSFYFFISHFESVSEIFTYAWMADNKTKS